MSEGRELVDFVECSVRGLCNHPEDVKIDQILNKGKSICLVINVNPDDVALVIGKQGNNIRSIREISWAIATKLKLKVTLIINE